MLSKKTEYAIKAIIYLETCVVEKRAIDINQISKAINSPVAFTAKILQQLKRLGLVESTTGPKGGFSLKDGRKISLMEVLIAMNDEEVFNKCVLGLPECSSDNPCPVHNKYKKIKSDLQDMMINTYIDEFTQDILNNIVSLK
jgi:Rrf2 family iron-sulfur cluster assembly transcriptional regulator